MTAAVVVTMAIPASAGTITSSFAAGVLTVNGTSGDDSIHVDCVGNNVVINTFNPDTGAVLCSDVVSIKISAAGGNDLVSIFFDDVSAPSLDSITVNGGVGSDTINGGKFGDTLKGGRGMDFLMGNDGNDILNGGTGVDGCNGGPGVDIRRNCEKH
ncbi:MAG: hypothetical protein WD004_02960 [Actinomycetota bacterium]